MGLDPFLYSTKGERRAVSVFMILLALTFLFRYYIYPSVKNSSQEVSSANETPDSVFVAKYEMFRNTLVEDKKFEKFNKRPVPELFRFDPNIADSATFIRLGFKPFIASNIIKYRNKGGVFRTKESLSKIYGVDSSFFKVLLPYINIDSAVFVSSHDAAIDTSGIFINIKFTEKRIVELNTCDTTLLKMIPGIGSYYASAIISYRDRLGGFCAINQLREIQSIPDSVYNNINEWLCADSDHIIPLDVNTLYVAALKRHPYINFYQAKAIVDIRRERGRIKSFEDLELLDEFSNADFERLKAYVRF